MVLASDVDYQILLQCMASIKKADPIVYVIDIIKQIVCSEKKENIKPEKDKIDSDDKK